MRMRCHRKLQYQHGVCVVSGTDPADEMSNALQSAAAGLPYYSTSICNTQGFADCCNGRFRYPVIRKITELSATQLEILLMRALGYQVREIADWLDMSYKAADSQLYRIRKALGVNNRVEMTRLCLREGLINTPKPARKVARDPHYSWSLQSSQCLGADVELSTRSIPEVKDVDRLA